MFVCRLGLSNNEIAVVENGTVAMMPHLRELHLEHNLLTSVPAGLSDHKYIQVSSKSSYDTCIFVRQRFLRIAG